MSVFCNVAKHHFSSLLMWLTYRYDSGEKPLLIGRKVMTIDSWHCAVLSNLLALCSQKEHIEMENRLRSLHLFKKSKH